MNKQKHYPSLPDSFNRFMVLFAGIVLLLIVTTWAGHMELRTTVRAARSAANTLKQQCISFDKLTAADRTKSLFRLSDLMRDLSTHLEHSPELVNDEYLEQYVDSLRLSGVAILDENLKLEASGYTRRFSSTNWVSSQNGSHFADIAEHSRKVYIERVLLDEEYYDICAVARKDAPGIIVGFYHQPSGLIADTRNDLESMIGGLQLEKDGRYIIAENGTVRVSSTELKTSATNEETDILKAFSDAPKDGRLHMIAANGKRYWGYHTGCNNYSLYIYYPTFAVRSVWLLTAAVFAALYSVVMLLFILFRNRSLYKKQEELEKSNSNLTQTVKMLKALETIYFTLFYVNLKENTFDAIYVAPWLKENIPESGRYTDLKQMFLDTMVVPEFYDDIDYRMSPDFINENLNKDKVTNIRKSFYTDYQAIRGGQVRWCRVTATVVDYADDGNPHHILALIQDIDKEKTREADYQAQIINEAKEAKIANDAKTDFLRRISHDIRTPINGIQGYIDLSARHPDDPVIQKHCRESAAVAVSILMDLVNSVLDMSKMERNEVKLEEKPFDLTELLDNANTILAPQAAAKKVRYEVLRKGAVPITHLIGSPRHMSRIIMNMTTNAVKYSRPGGYIRVCTNLVGKTDNEVTYEFVCEDNGIGMSKEFQQHMFEPFMQEAINARTNYEGVGLGLAILKKLVDAMGGTVTCESEKNVGTTFRLNMTFKIDKNYHDSADALKNMEGKSLSGRNILIAEDNELNMEIAELLLAEHGANIIKAWSGKEAAERFAASEIGFYDVIFMDIMMPEMTGLDATRKIRAMERPDAKTIPIIAMSANAFQDDVQSSKDAGMNMHIAKPIDNEKLMEALSSMLDGTDNGI